MDLKAKTLAMLLLFGSVVGAGCGPTSDGPAQAEPQVQNSSAAASDTRPVVLCLGTSLTAGPGLTPAETWPALLQQKSDSAGYQFRFINAGVSGETSAGALRRIDWLFSRGPIRVVVIETGANDMLRGQSVDSLRRNLDSILVLITGRDPRPIIALAAMEALPNLGVDYGKAFRSIYPELAERHQAVLLPFLLAGVAGVDSLNQPDGVHPTPQGEQIVAGNLWQSLEPVLRKAERGEG